jgi:hypothetical protein
VTVFVCAGMESTLVGPLLQGTLPSKGLSAATDRRLQAAIGIGGIAIAFRGIGSPGETGIGVLLLVATIGGDIRLGDIPGGKVGGVVETQVLSAIWQLALPDKDWQGPGS